MSLNDLRSKANKLPNQSGVYLMKDKEHDIIYVGKAKNLKNRVVSYFIKDSTNNLKKKALVSKIVSFDIIIVNTEKEALILERQLIKKHKPQYNILFRDDKDYPYIKIDFKQKWPRVYKVRKKKNDGAKYFGPFTSSEDLKNILFRVYKVFPVVRCSEYEFKLRKKPCHYYHMKQCLAPCVKKVSHDSYLKIMDLVSSVLSGKMSHIVSDLKKEMQKASDFEDFELAASLRDQIEAFKTLKEKQNVSISSPKSIDVIGFFADKDNIVISLLVFRSSFLVDQKSFVLFNTFDTEEVLYSFILQFYSQENFPDQIILPCELKDQELFLETYKLKKNTFLLAKTRYHLDLMHMANKNAKYFLKEYKTKEESIRSELVQIKKKFNLLNLPRKIECIDISNLQEKATVASVVCFKDGKADKKNYKIYKITSVFDKPNDYGSIFEVLCRRLERAKREKKLPDLILIDGGKGQLSSAKKAFEKFDIKNCDLLSIAKSHALKAKSLKDKKTLRSFERIFKQDEEDVALIPGDFDFSFFTSIRDEAHRFALRHHRAQRDLSFKQSVLMSVKGIGPVLQKRILEHFQGIENIKNSSIEDLLEVKGINKDMALEILKKIQKN